MCAARAIFLWNSTADVDSKKPLGFNLFAPSNGPGPARPRWCRVPEMVLVPLRPVPVTRTRTPPMSAPRDDSVQHGVLPLVRREAGALLLVHHGEAVVVDEA